MSRCTAITVSLAQEVDKAIFYKCYYPDNTTYPFLQFRIVKCLLYQIIARD